MVLTSYQNMALFWTIALASSTHSSSLAAQRIKNVMLLLQPVNKIRLLMCVQCQHQDYDLPSCTGRVKDVVEKYKYMYMGSFP